MASQKAVDNANRLRYIRALERFHKSITSFLSTNADISKESYTKKIDANLKMLQRVEEVALYKGDLQDLQKLIKRAVELQASDKDMDDIKEEVLYASNQLDKTKNARRYKKDKYSQSKYSDWE